MTMKRKGPEMTAPLLRELTLPCGAALPNRIAKAAMTEGLATMAGGATTATCGPSRVSSKPITGRRSGASNMCSVRNKPMPSAPSCRPRPRRPA